jgi:hypothetical protein
MLRRYLIMDVATTAAGYFAYSVFVPSMSSVWQAAHGAVQTFVMGHTLLSPMIDHMIVVSAGFAGSLTAGF